jgi:hypothetical protein
MTEIAFTFDGRPVAARPGQSLAAALTEAGVRAFRDTVGGAERGVFCGMGVCQDCLVTVDGVPNRRACMTPVAAGMEVAKQVALPDFSQAAQAPKAGEARVIAPDVLILGGGAGGLSAAIAARAAGASVVVLDERKVGGGQYYKQAADASGARCPAGGGRGARGRRAGERGGDRAGRRDLGRLRRADGAGRRGRRGPDRAAEDADRGDRRLRAARDGARLDAAGRDDDGRRADALAELPDPAGPPRRGLRVGAAQPSGRPRTR